MMRRLRRVESFPGRNHLTTRVEVNPRFGKTPLKIVLSLAQILLKNGNFTENVLHSTQIVGGVSRRRCNRALESPPTKINTQRFYK